MEAQAQAAALERSVDLNAGVMCRPTMGWHDLCSHFKGFTKTDQPADRRYGGTLWLASGTKPRR